LPVSTVSQRVGEVCNIHLIEKRDLNVVSYTAAKRRAGCGRSRRRGSGLVLRRPALAQVGWIVSDVVSQPLFHGRFYRGGHRPFPIYHSEYCLQVVAISCDLTDPRHLLQFSNGWSLGLA